MTCKLCYWSPYTKRKDVKPMETTGKHRKASLDLRAEVASLIHDGCSKRHVRLKITEDKNCTATEKLEILKSIHMEE